jgi:type II secretory pathway pseudopilin PulG
LQPLFRQVGYTVIEIIFVLAIIGILGAFALPNYRDYRERALLASTVSAFGDMREKAAILAGTTGKDLCKWPVKQIKSGSDFRFDIDTADLIGVVDRVFKSLDPKVWTPAVNHLSGDLSTGKETRLTVQFGGIGIPGVARIKELAKEFSRVGWTPTWTRDLKMAATFTVDLGSCAKDAGDAKVIASLTTAAAPPLTVTAAAPTCTLAEQLSADKSRCEPKTCPTGTRINGSTGICEADHSPVSTAGAAANAYGCAAPLQPAYVITSMTYGVVEEPPRCLPACPPEKPYSYADKSKGYQQVCEGSDPRPVPVSPPDATCTTNKQNSPLSDFDIAVKRRYAYATCPDGDSFQCAVAASPSTGLPADGSQGSRYCEPGTFPSVVLVNNKDGTRTMERKCMPAAECKVAWWNDTSNEDSCMNIGSKTLTSDLKCTYCCAGDFCNGIDVLNSGGNTKGRGGCPVDLDFALRWQ